MIKEAEILNRWLPQKEILGIDGLFLSLAEFCQADPVNGKLLAQNLRESRLVQMGECSLSCLAEIFSRTASECDALLTTKEEKWKMRAPGDKGAQATGRQWKVLAWRYGDPWRLEEDVDPYWISDAMMYLTGSFDRPAALIDVKTFGEVKAEILRAARAGYFGQEEFSQRMQGDQECLDRIVYAITRVLEPIELGEAAGPATSLKKPVGL